MAAGHEPDAVNAAVVGPIAAAMRTRLLRRALVASPSPRFSGERGRYPRILPMLRVAAMPMMPVVALISARLFRLHLVAAAEVTLTMTLLAMAAPAIA